MAAELPAAQLHDADGLAHALGPVLREICGGVLADIEWFRSQWQRGGAATGFSAWARPHAPPIPVMVKFPVSPGEYRWTLALGQTPLERWDERRELSTPRVVASGQELGGYDLAWIVMERFEGSPLAAHVDEIGLRAILAATLDFHARAARVAPVDACPVGPNWEWLVDHGRQLVRSGSTPEPQRWGEALRRVHKALPALVARWHRRGHDTWCHGDVHPGNAMRRAGMATDRGVLIDLAMVHAGHWIEDALYLERQFWGHAGYLHGLKPVSELARLRREHGLDAQGDYAELANVRRVLAAAAAPAMLDREGNPKYLHAALEHIEKLLPQVTHA